jgi:uncharacterized iron-regulated protein
MRNQSLNSFRIFVHRGLIPIGLIILVVLGGCGMPPEQLKITDLETAFPPETIIDTTSGEPISMEQLIQAMAHVQIIYVGEIHTNTRHHVIQRDVIEALQAAWPDIVVGMEMFDKTYQPVLDQWSAGELDEQRFLELTHWYANWKFNFALYRPILTSIKAHGLTLIGLNLPFKIPSKISTGGIASLQPEDARHLPDQIDLTNSDHRAYVENIYRHHQIRGRDNFDYFYEAQCAWEDTMADTIARTLDDRKMVVIIGNGHIIHKYGVPDRAFARTGAAFRTVYLAPAGKEVQSDIADYIWVTPNPQ